MTDKLKIIRDRIDAFDDRILELLNERARLAQEIGGAKRGASNIALSGFTSFAAGRRPISAASNAVVPRPENGSNTVSLCRVRRSMKNAGSCGLKHAR